MCICLVVVRLHLNRRNKHESEFYFESVEETQTQSCIHVVQIFCIFFFF